MEITARPDTTGTGDIHTYLLYTLHGASFSTRVIGNLEYLDTWPPVLLKFKNAQKLWHAEKPSNYI